jgi:fatty-acyl-CoA synthase
MDPYPNVATDSALLIKHLLERPLAWAPEEKIIYRDLREINYREFHERVARLAAVLHQLGIGPGDRVGVMDWDSHRYLEFFFAVPMMGAVLHTINVRLSPEQLLYTINHAEDKALFFHPDFVPLLEAMAGHCGHVQAFVAMPDHGDPPPVSFPLAGEYERLLAASQPVEAFPDLPENTVATLFYTTGTTGEPKGVFFTHRQLVLHTMTAGFALSANPDPCGIHYRDVYMPLTPMFHVHGWGVPYIATLLGLRQIYPGRYEPAMLLRLIHQHRVTLSHGVPTLLQMVLHAKEAAHLDLSHWKLIVGGAKLPAALAREAIDRGIRIAQGYGMSETCPIIALSNYKPGVAEAPLEERMGVLVRTGFPLPLVRARILDATGKSLPPGPENVGELALQAPWLTTGYFKEEEKSRALWEGGWLHTGDLAYLDADGYIRITDRLKDVIKIGGEWISSLDLENALSHHEAVQEVAVIAVADAKWGERPLALVVPRPTHPHPPTSRELGAFLHTFIETGSLHKRAVLTRIMLVDQLPRTSVGKIDKKTLRATRTLNSPE